HLRLCVVHVWTVPEWNNPKKIKTFEMVFVDELGTTIHGLVNGECVENFRSILTDGVAIQLANFQVDRSAGTWRYTDHTYKITFQPDTLVKVLDNYSGPMHHFDFKTFEEIIDHTLSNNQIIDIIGLVVAVGAEIPGFTPTNKPNKRRVLCLEDTEGTQIDCTLWDSYVEQFNKFLEAQNDDKPIVIIVQFGKVKGYNKGALSFGTSLYATKLYFNDDIPAIQQFMDRMKEKQEDGTSSLKVPTVSTNATLSSPSSFYKNCFPVNLNELHRVTEVKRCATIATIQSVIKNRSWYYIACTKCKGGAKPITNGDSAENGSLNSLWKCSGCSKPVESVSTRYKVYVRVVDDTGSSTFILFDNDIKKLITLNPLNLSGVVGNSGENIPEELEDLAGHKALFDYTVSKFWNLDKGKHEYTVSKLTKDKEVLDAFRKDNGIEVENISEDDSTTPSLESNESNIHPIVLYGCNIRIRGFSVQSVR
uniref:replication protein A 70 kDa DNA-binding subunit C-like n=1 Tax=Erigeron canadensis TaxID=72917 RepID=UPI001CB8B114